MNDELKKYDDWVKNDDGPAALVLREHLMAVEGTDGVVFPATFAASEDKTTFKGGYNIDTFGDEKDGKNVCLVDSVGSQANRIEPLFARDKYRGLVPQVVIKAGTKKVNLLEAGHRAGDAIVRCCQDLKGELQGAFKAVQRGDAEPLARIAPTSLVFGVWDSRDTQAKLPRLVASTIRAFDVRRLTRSATYMPATDYVEEGLLEEPEDLKDAEGKVKGKHPFAQRGFVHVPASGSHGGVIATGGIRRDATLHLAALRLIYASDDWDKTLALRRYILGLALTAFTYPPVNYLRQGCNLVIDPGKPAEYVAVYGDGRRPNIKIDHVKDALPYAVLAAKVFFGIDPAADLPVRPDREVSFDNELAKKDLDGPIEKLKGKIVAVDKESQKFTVNTGGKAPKDQVISMTETTEYLKGKNKSSAEEVVVQGKKVEVEAESGIALKVTAK
jgi:CRISPR-associated protein Csb1